MTHPPSRLTPSPSPCHDPAALRPDDRGAGMILWQVLVPGSATPVARPEVPPDLPEMSPVVRVHACLRLFLLDMEFALSPGGHLRGACKWACRTSLALAFIALCAAGVAMGVAIAGIILQKLVAVLWLLLQALLLLVALLVIAVGLILGARLVSTAAGSSAIRGVRRDRRTTW
jgi:hypothetical protein